jgi:hypothetical protein
MSKIKKTIYDDEPQKQTTGEGMVENIKQGKDQKEELKRLNTKLNDSMEVAVRNKDVSMQAQLRKIAANKSKVLGKGLISSIPIVGSIVSSIISKDASAGVPILGDVESVGPDRNSLEGKLEAGEQMSKQELVELAKKRAEVMRRYRAE